MYEGKSNVKVSPQESYKKGKNARYGEKDSVRPDISIEKNGKLVETYEVKNYKKENYDNMASKIGEQAIKRAKNLPDNPVQKVIIDARGQKITKEIKQNVIKKIIEKSNEIIKEENIIFME